jgi:phosphoadenosine phosphosulfate reductase
MFKGDKMTHEIESTILTFDEAASPAGWSPEVLKQIGQDLEGRPPQEVLRWGIANFEPAISMATGFGPEGVVLMHLLSEIAPETAVFYLDTDLFFRETYALRDELETRFGLQFIRITADLSLEDQAAQYGPKVWERDPDLCCYLRKVEPLRRYLSTQHAWITAIRRDQTRHRANAGLVEWDHGNGLVKLNPIAAWTSDQVWEHIRAHDLPVNPLHAQGYPSIGCWPCTLPFISGDDPRSGRWAGLPKTECGIHLQHNKS